MASPSRQPQPALKRVPASCPVTVAIAATIYRVFDLPCGYWVPLTVCVVMRPDFGSTFTRGLQRYAGTAVGAVLVPLIAATFNPGPYALAALSTLLAVGIFAFPLRQLWAVHNLDDRLNHFRRGVRWCSRVDHSD